MVEKVKSSKPIDLEIYNDIWVGQGQIAMYKEASHHLITPFCSFLLILSNYSVHVNARELTSLRQAQDMFKQ